MTLYRRVAAWCLAAAMAGAVWAADQPSTGQPELPWIEGPGSAKIGDKAAIKLTDQLVYLDESGTRRFLELTGNPPRDGHYTVAPKEGEWFAVFSFDPVGYVKDDEAIDAEALLKSIQSHDEEGNKERKRLGLDAIHADGWHVPPHYDPATHRLEWGLRLRDDKGGVFVNYSTRLLGRTGVMSAILVTDPQSLDKDRREFNAMLTGFEYLPGERYAEYKSGDKLAGYGLAALVAGGAAAAAAKTGFLKGAWKAVAAAVLFFGAALWGFVKKIFGRR